MLGQGGDSSSNRERNRKGPCDLEAAGSEIANLKLMGFRDLGAAVNEIANLKPMGLWDLWRQSAEKSQT